MIPLGILATTAGGGGGGAYELIETAYGTGSSGTITFSSVPQTYKHLQLRITARSTATGGTLTVPINGVGSGFYSYHYLSNVLGGSTVESYGLTGTLAAIGYPAVSGTTANAYCSFIVDILDYASTNKRKTVRSIGGLSSGVSSTSQIAMYSNMADVTTAVSSVSAVLNTGSFTTQSRVSLYGLKG